jgi:soluble lytic murein transglycosylase-like protein
VFVWTSISIAATTAGNSSIRNKPGHNACVLAAQKIEAEQRLPRMLLSTISLVETGKWVRETRENIAWPWTVNARGQSRYYRSKTTAIAAVRRLQSSGLRSIDVGCMQINLYYHPDAFASLEEAFDPQTNVSYAADFLKSLRKKGRSWNTAIGYYHSRTRARYIPYQRKVQKLWRAERRRVALERRAKQRRTASRTIVEY